MGVEDGGRLGRGPAPLALPGPMEPPGPPEPGVEEADCAAGLLAGSEGGVDICYRGKDTEVREMPWITSFRNDKDLFSSLILCK